jgi:Holliday junction resolvase
MSKGGSAPKRKGSAFEREVVERAKEGGLNARRAWGSNGKALGLSEEVDILIENEAVQAKVRKKLPAFLAIPEAADSVVFKRDRGEILVLTDLEHYLLLLQNSKLYKEIKS